MVLCNNMLKTDMLKKKKTLNNNIIKWEIAFQIENAFFNPKK